MVYITSFTSFERDSKWGCRLYMTSLSMGRKSQPTKQPINYVYKEKRPKRAYTGEQCPRHLYMLPHRRERHCRVVVVNYS